MNEIRLTEYSHGSGCGCKIAPAVLDDILAGVKQGIDTADLLVGNDHKDDAAVMAIDEQRALISTTDFFMPIVDDPFDFGRIAATNAISDVYAMGGRPLLAISIFGWPLDKLSAETGRQVIEGGRQACADAGIPLAGGHSIDSPEPIFGLAVTGMVERSRLKTNAGARPGDLLYLTKPLGIGILTTARKKKLLRQEDERLATGWMLKLNKIGYDLGGLAGVHALTDVTGFGLLGHLVEMCEASGVSATVRADEVPLIAGIDHYIALGCMPGGTGRNFKSYGHKITTLNERQRATLCDPQTSGGLLIAVAPEEVPAFEYILNRHDLLLTSFGEITLQKDKVVQVE